MMLNYEITPSDHLEKVNVQYGFRARRGRILLGVICTAVGVLCCFVFGKSWIVVAAVFATLTAVQIRLPRIIHHRVYSRNPQLFEMRKVTFGEEGVKSERASGTIEVKWTAFQKFKETTNLFLTYQTKDAVGIVPKRAFASSEDVDRFRSLLASKMPRE